MQHTYIQLVTDSEISECFHISLYLCVFAPLR